MSDSKKEGLPGPFLEVHSNGNTSDESVQEGNYPSESKHLTLA